MLFSLAVATLAVAFFLLGYMFGLVSAFKITDVSPACLEDLHRVYRPY